MTSPFERILAPLSAPLIPNEFSKRGGTLDTSNFLTSSLTSKITEQSTLPEGPAWFERAAESIKKPEESCEDPSSYTNDRSHARDRGCVARFGSQYWAGFDAGLQIPKDNDDASTPNNLREICEEEEEEEEAIIGEYSAYGKVECNEYDAGCDDVRGDGFCEGWRDGFAAGTRGQDGAAEKRDVLEIMDNGSKDAHMKLNDRKDNGAT